MFLLRALKECKNTHGHSFFVSNMEITGNTVTAGQKGGWVMIANVFESFGHKLKMKIRNSINGWVQVGLFDASVALPPPQAEYDLHNSIFSFNTWEVFMQGPVSTIILKRHKNRKISVYVNNTLQKTSGPLPACYVYVGVCNTGTEVEIV